MIDRLIIFTDGASKGNPGPASIGAVGFLRDGNYSISDFSLSRFKANDLDSVFSLSESIGTKTNNEAEYEALLKALTFASKIKDHSSISLIDVFMDSELIVKQMKKEYKVKKPELKLYYNQIQELSFFSEIQFTHVKREYNKIADFLANEALKKQ